MAPPDTRPILVTQYHRVKLKGESDTPPPDIDLKIFVDYAITVRVEHEKVEVIELQTGEVETFDDLIDAIDYAAVRSSTVTPRYPAGYRSRAVRRFEVLGVDSVRSLMNLLANGEHVTIEHVDLPEEPPEPDLKTVARRYMQLAAEAETLDERRGWLERARDTLRIYETRKRENDPRYIPKPAPHGAADSGEARPVAPAARRHPRYIARGSQEEHERRQALQAHVARNMAAGTAAGRPPSEVATDRAASAAQPSLGDTPRSSRHVGAASSAT